MIHLEIDQLPKLTIGIWPTPITKLENLSEKYNTNLYIKRDDLTGVLLGGNKVRKLEYFFADALSQNKQTIITTGSAHSNHNSLTVAIANMLGLSTYLVVALDENETISENKDINGNLLLQNLSEANFVFTKKDETSKTIHTLLKKLEEEGKKPYFIPVGGHAPLGLCGYITAMKEIQAQSQTLGINFDYMAVCVGTGTTAVGLYLGKIIYNYPTDLIGINVLKDNECILVDSQQIIAEFNEKYNTKYDFKEASIRFVDDYLTGGYGKHDKSIFDTIELLVKEEGILMDPIYTAKSFMGLLKMIETDKGMQNKSILYIHTGGLPILFEKGSRDFLVDNLADLRL